MQNKNNRNRIHELISTQFSQLSQARESNAPSDSLARTLQRNKTQYYESLLRASDHPLNEEEVTVEQYQVVGEGEIQKLSEVVKNIVIKNKLNSRNAFEVPLIDVNSLGVIKNIDDGAWNKISNVLENSSKVYGFRVDFMVEGINKMTNNMARSQKTHQLDILHKNRPISANNLSSGSTIENEGSTSDNYSNEPGWNQEIYSKHLEADKINNNLSQVCQDVSHSSIRRLFDQNGVAGMLMGRLPITSSLNIVIDSSIQYPAIHRPIADAALSSVCKSAIQQFDMFISEEMKMLKDFCFRQHDQERFDQADMPMQDCYNLYFDQQPENFRSEAHLHEDIFNWMKDPIQENQLDEENDRSQKQLSEITISRIDMVNKTIAAEIEGDLQPLDSNCKNKNKQERNNNKQRLPREKKERKRKRKQEETNIDFSTELKLQDRSAILSASGSIANKERKKKEKNMIDKVVPDFLLQQQTNYHPILPPEFASLPQRNDERDMKLEINQLSHPPSLNLYQNMFSQMSSSMCVIVPNIKDTKTFLWELIKNEKHVSLSNLLQIYEKQRGMISEALLFLAVLHLGNQYNLSIQEGANFQIDIFNQFEQI